MKYRIEGASKFMKAANGNEVCVEATGCEMFLWAEREKMIAVLRMCASVLPLDSGILTAVEDLISEAEGETA